MYDTVYVGGFEIKIEDGSHDLELMQLMGQFISMQSKIRVRTVGVDEQLQAQTLLHEIGHVIEMVYLEGDELTHRQLSAFTQGFYQVLRDNSDLITMICNTEYNNDGDALTDVCTSCSEETCSCESGACTDRQ